MSVRRLPPLQALQVFCVVAREGNMSRAATTLFVTQSAVSRQIRQLEAHLGIALFERQARGLALTQAGQRLLPAIEAAFAGIVHAVDDLLPRPADLKIKLPPTLALRWFLPRLADFQAAHPDVEVRMSTVSHMQINFARDDFDAAIVFAAAPPTDVHAVALFAESVTPVCSPEVAQRLQVPADLTKESLIHLSSDHSDWRGWLALAQIEHPMLTAGPSFDVMDMAVNVAGQGLGVAIADPVLIADDLLCRRLVTPFPALKLVMPASYWYVWPKSRSTAPAILAMRDWLLVRLAQTFADLNCAWPMD